MAKILLAGLDRETASEFSAKLTHLGHHIDAKPLDVQSVESRDADVIFASGEDVRCNGALLRLRAKGSQVPFIVVSRVAEEERWLAALEAGATDYCSAGIDLGNLRWVLENALRNAQPRKSLTFAA